MTKLLLNLQQKDNYPIETQVKGTKKKFIEGKMQTINKHVEILDLTRNKRNAR